MRKTIFTYALITSPLLALFAVSPFFIFDVLDLKRGFGFFISVQISVILYWLINHYLFVIREKEFRWNFILLSYFLTFFSNILKAPFQSFVQFRGVVEQYLVQPIAMTIVLNTLILLIINVIVGESKRQKADRTIATLRMQKLEAENQVLMRQLQPHFLFNALSILKSLIQENASMAETYTVKLSDFLRYAVESHQAEMVSIADEMAFVENYVALQKIRFEEAFTFEAELPADIMSYRVPVFALQTLVENAFKHNYFTEKRPLHIRIEAEAGCLKVVNNIVSLKVTERAGTGLENLSKRSAFLTEKPIDIIQTDTQFQVLLPYVSP
ncbi:MAG: sensor histidine kinase [Bacteroidota bacterium]